jgi:hypothetical protein
MALVTLGLRHPVKFARVLQAIDREDTGSMSEPEMQRATSRTDGTVIDYLLTMPAAGGPARSRRSRLLQGVP